MAGKPIGTIYAELDLDTTKYTKAQQAILQSAKSTALNVEQNWKILGQKSDVMYNAMRQSAINAYEMIKNKAGTSASEIIRAEEAKNAKIKTLNEQQFGHHTTLIEGLKKNWIAVSAAIVAAWALVSKAVAYAEEGARAKQVAESFEMITRAQAVNGEALISGMKKVSGVFVDETDIMIKAQRALMEGFSPEQIIKMTEASRIAARLMGTNVEEAFEKITEALITMRTRGLKAAFPMDEAKVFDQYARSLGTVANYLTEAGKQQAIYNEIARQSEERLQVMGGQLLPTEAEKLQQMASAWKEVKEALGTTFIDVFSKIVEVFGEIIYRVDAAIEKIRAFEATMAGIAAIPGKIWEKIFGSATPVVPSGLASSHAGGIVPEQIALIASHGAGYKPSESLVDYGKMRKDQEQIDLEYQAKFLDLTNQRIEALGKERDKAIAATKEKGLKTFEMEKFYNEAIKRERESLDIAKKMPMAESMVEQAKLLNNLGQIQKAESDVFELKMRQLRTTKEYTPELEKQLRFVFGMKEARESEMVNLSRATAIAESALAEANLLGNIELIEKAEKRVFDLRMQQLKTTMQYTPELEKQLKITSDLEQSEKRRAYNAEMMKYPVYEAPPMTEEIEAAKVIDDRRRAVLELSDQYAQMTGNLSDQIQISKDLDALEIRRIERELGGDQRLIDLTKQLGDLKRQQIALDYQRQTIDFNRQTAEMTGHWNNLKVAEEAVLEIERQILLLRYKQSPEIQKQINLLYDMKAAEVEAQRTMNIPKLIDIGAQKSAIDYNKQLADQYMNLIPSSLNVGQSALSGFFSNLRSGTMSAGDAFKKMADDFVGGIMKMIEEIGFLIIKMKILESLGYGTGATSMAGGGGGGFNLMSLFGLFGGGGGLSAPAGSWGYGLGGPAAEGAYVTKPTLLLAGEKGPEYVIPESKISSLSRRDSYDKNEGRQKPINVTVQMNINTPDANSFRASQSQVVGKYAVALQQAMKKM